MNTHRTTTPARSPRTARGIGAGTAAVSAAVLLAVATATPAAAHDQLLSATPAAGTAVLEAPAEIGLEFSGDLTTGQGIQNLVTVTDEDGHQWQDGAAQVAGPNLTAAVCEGLPNGEYTVDYRIVYSDGHSEEKDYEFTLEDPAAPESAAPEDCGVPNPDASVSSDATPGEAGTDGAGAAADDGGTTATDAKDPATTATTAATAGPGTAATDPASGEATAEDSQAPAGPVAGWVWPAAIGGVLVVVVAMLMVFRKARAIDAGSSSRGDGAGNADGTNGGDGTDGGSSGTGTSDR
jgi:hypothetical protein